jgi:hypothetical protein
MENNIKSFNIGDYIEYEYYGSRSYGCIISKNKDSFDVIKIYNGQIWCLVRPIRKISKEEFFSEFYIFDEYQTELLKKMDVLPEDFQNIIKTKIEKKRLTVITRMVLFCLINKINYPNTNNITINDEVWAIKWYILNVLRNHEPYSIKKTVDFCQGATELVKEFMVTNINFMVSMQFQPDYLSHMMIILIQERWLEFIYKKNLISSREYLSRHFPIVIKKLEALLVLKQPVVDDIKLEIYICKDKCNYKMDTTLLNIINTKFAFGNSYNKYLSNKRSDCSKRIKVNLDWSMTSDDCCKIKKWEKIPGEISRTDCPRFIKKIDDCSSFYLTSQKNILIQKDKYSNGTCEVVHFNLYCVKTEKLLGSFEFNTDEEDLCFLDLEDIRKVN